MKKNVIFFWLCSMAFSHATSQKEGDSWIIGYSRSTNPNYSVLKLDFKSGNMVVKRMPGEYSQTAETCSTICDDDGNL